MTNPMLSRSAILRDAHSRARQLRQEERHVRADWQKWTNYRKALNFGMPEAWAVAKQQAAQAARDAAMVDDAEDAPLPADVLARIADLHILAGVQPLNSYGAAHFRAIRADADDIARAARCISIPAPSQHHAHL